MPILDKLRVNIGLKVTHEKTITLADIDGFAQVSGGFNPVHMQEEYTKNTFFEGCGAGNQALWCMACSNRRYQY